MKTQNWILPTSDSFPLIMSLFFRNKINMCLWMWGSLYNLEVSSVSYILQRKETCFLFHKELPFKSFIFLLPDSHSKWGREWHCWRKENSNSELHESAHITSSVSWSWHQGIYSGRLFIFYHKWPNTTKGTSCLLLKKNEIFALSITVDLTSFPMIPNL